VIIPSFLRRVRDKFSDENSKSEDAIYSVSYPNSLEKDTKKEKVFISMVLHIPGLFHSRHKPPGTEVPGS
jgi:hypothetical protein